MSILTTRRMTRRNFLASACASTAALGLPLPLVSSAATTRQFKLRAAPGQVRLVPEPYNQTPVWCFNQTVPGPEIRLRQGERIRIEVENALAEESSVHWHGIRTPNAMDGVSHLTQPPIAPGGKFIYEFDAVDAGSYWYHPHQRSFEQVGRGLYGAFIVEERDPIRVDRDLCWMLDDWRLTPAAEISDDFGNGHDVSHNGRIGNSVTINGQIREHFAVRRGERIRLRLVNAANARIFSLDFKDHNPVIIAIDGQPVSPHAPQDGRVLLAPAMRIDLVLDMLAENGSSVAVTDRFYRGREYRLIDLVYAAEGLREEPPDWPMALAPNPLAEPDLEQAIRHEVVFNGGMMGGSGSMMDMMSSGKVWSINGVAAEGHVMKPMLELKLGQSYLLAMNNDTAWHHPMHLHGHAFRVMSRNGQATAYREWQDTVLMAPRERVEIAFVADNPGDWMFHCHILEHMAAGMMGVIRVAS